MTSYIGTGTRPDSYEEEEVGGFFAVGKSSTDPCRVEVEGLRVINFFSLRKSNDDIREISIK